MEFRSVDDVLDFAIANEEEAFAFYNDLAHKVKRPGMHEVFQQFALEEKGHKEKLLAVKRDGAPDLLGASSAGGPVDLKMSDYLVDVKPKEDMDYQDALILAMKKEKAAFRLYTDLARQAGSGALRALFETLAEEEAKHKLRFEIEYDEYVLQEN